MPSSSNDGLMIPAAILISDQRITPVTHNESFLSDKWQLYQFHPEAESNITNNSQLSSIVPASSCQANSDVVGRSIFNCCMLSEPTINQTASSEIDWDQWRAVMFGAG